MRYLFVCFILGAVTLCGCGGGSGGRGKIEGTITFKGQPLDQGTIQFVQLKGEGTGAVIVNGKYSIPAEKGLQPGTYTIMISSGEAGKPVDAAVPPGESGPVNKDRIPADWNVNSRKTVDVTASGPNVFDFTIP